MKISCNIIQDLLPLYYDKVCSDESNKLVVEHIKECKICRNQLEIMEEELENTIVLEKGVKDLKDIADTLKRDKRKSVFKGVLVSFITFIIISGGFIGLTEWKVKPVSSDLLDVSEVYRLSDGRIVYHLNIKDDKDLRAIKFKATENGEFYMTPIRSLIEKKRQMEDGLFDDYYVLDIDETEGITSCYVGSKANPILIWEEGMELPKASEELEKKVAEEHSIIPSK